MKPRRIQLSRKKGWRLPANTIVVARPGRWGNPFRVGSTLTQVSGTEQGRTFEVTPEIAVRMFRELVTSDSPAGEATRSAAKTELRGKHLACWCPLDQPCHADVLLEIANA